MGSNETSSYQLPHDDVEHRRLDLQHRALLSLMHNAPIRAPLSTDMPPKRILDVGCGTGAMTVWLAQKFPSSEVVAIDIADVPSIHDRPSNVRYFKGSLADLVASGTLEVGTWDFVFARLLVLGITDWRSHTSTLFSLLAPGGWVELQEYNWECLNANNRVVSNDWMYMRALHREMVRRGMDPFAGYHLPHYLSMSGFERISYASAPLPKTYWSAHPETELYARTWQENRTHQERAAKKLIDKILGGSGAIQNHDLEACKDDITRTLQQMKEGDHHILSICWARKPNVEHG